MEIEADDGRRIRLELFGENYYLSVCRGGGRWVGVQADRATRE